MNRKLPWHALICRVINDLTPASRRRRTVVSIAVGVALCLVTLGLWLTFAGRREEGRGQQAREIELEVTSEAGQVQSINWRYPDDEYQIHNVSDRPGGPVKTPWSQRIDVKATRGPINLNVVHDPDSTGATCQILVNGKVVEEQSGPFPHCMITVQRAFPAS